MFVSFRAVVLISVSELALLGAVLSAEVVQSPAATGQTVTQSQIEAVILATQDEIYANRYETPYVDLGPQGVRIYVSPRMGHGLIWVVYKLMPHGELMRAAYLSKDGTLALLEGDVRSGFPPTNGAAMKTVYLDDDDVIRMKTTWKKFYFAIEINPSAQRREHARRREAARSALRNK